ncbi:reverse transcriptase domain-containing protein [Tanacetum coccineum]|uniref:Reverse transcriptase domain-containing protein n=1 Tax=Tanacetum coccineum TaxID=301880 RepID=A0ABQ5HRU3_9ASTR
MIKDRQFDGRSRADPHKHIAEFVEIWGMFQYGNTNADTNKLKLFPSSLTGEAKIWFNELSPGVITTWEEMRQAFISETPLDKEFNEFMSENVQEDEIKDDFEELPPEDELRIKKSIQDPPTDLDMKPFPKHLEYAFLEENSLLPVVISALLEQNEKEQLVSVLKNHKEAFAWKTSDIPRISPSFCKHKINLEDDVKPVIQRQSRLNSNMKEVDGEFVSTTPIMKRLLSLALMEPTPTSVCLLVFATYQQLFKVVFTDHAAIKYLFSKQDAKPRLIRWILLLQEFDIEIKNKKGAKNIAADHLSRLEKPNLNDEEINDEFPDEFLMSIKTDEEESPWFADFGNYLVGGIL